MLRECHIGEITLKIVDASNPIPKYLQISSWLKEVIQSGRYKVGERLPSEVELSQMCGVNRNTLRQAIAELTAAGILRKEKGTGTFVNSPAASELRHKLERIYSFRDMLGQSGIKAKTIVVEKGIEKADDYVAKPFHLEEVLARVRALLRRSAGHDSPLVGRKLRGPADCAHLDELKIGADLEMAFHAGIGIGDDADHGAVQPLTGFKHVLIHQFG